MRDYFAARSVNACAGAMPNLRGPDATRRRIDAMRSVPDSMSRVTDSARVVSGPVSGVTGSAMRVTGSAMRVTGSAMRVTGAVRSVTDSLRRVTGALRSVTDSLPNNQNQPKSQENTLALKPGTGKNMGGEFGKKRFAAFFGSNTDLPHYATLPHRYPQVRISR